MPSFAVTRQSLNPERPSATFESLPREIMRKIVTELQEDMHSACMLALEYPVYEFHVGDIIFREYNSTQPHDLSCLLYYINELPQYAAFVTRITLDINIDDEMSSGVFELLRDIATGQSSTADWYLDFLAHHVNTVHFVPENIPDWLHIWCVGMLLVNAGPWVMEFSMPRAWNDPHFNIRARFPLLRGLVFT